MKNYLFLIALLATILWFACNTEKTVQQMSPWEGDRPHDPWVFRSVLDTQARMVTLALDDNLWVAYSAQFGALYKAWRGRVEFDGAVYTTAHGPQPLSIGDAWMLDEIKTPWRLKVNGAEVKPEVQYCGHRFKNGRAALMYDLKHNGTTIRITESPEYIENDGGLSGLERIFTTSEVPEGTEVLMDASFGSIALAESIQTDGSFKSSSTTPMQSGSISGLNVKGQLTLKPNASTRFAAYFVKKPLIEDPRKKDVIGEEEDTPLGQRLIARNDCKTCHNLNRKTIGPAYVDVAKKYANTEENIVMLVSKVKNGGYGVWGEQAMNAHPDVPESDIRAMVEYVMSLDKNEEKDNPTATTVATAPEDLDYVYANKEITADDMFPGVVTKVYLSKRPLAKLADVRTNIRPVFAGVMPRIHAQSADLKGLESNFAIMFNGYLNIKEAGNYQFRLRSDDGSRLSIGDQVVVDHDGLHGADAKDGSIALDEGYHKIKVEYFQGMGGKSVSLMWRTDDSEYVLVPTTALVHNVKDRPGKGFTLPMASERRIPGDGIALTEVHPSYDLSQARPETFLPKVGGMDFLSDGRLVVSTWDANGSVYLLDGVQSGDPSKINVTLIAKGFAEPLGLKVVDDEIYVLQKQELTRLIDLDGDDIIDEYQTVSNAWKVSPNFHEFAFGLAYKDGYFYAALATAINPGGASTQPQIQDRGKAVKISKEDGSLEFLAHGLRTPNGVGLGVDDELFITDNQGDWLPSCKLVHVEKGDWFGSRSVDFEGTADLTEKKPVVWLPQDEIGNSPGTPLAINDGPYKGQMIHCEITHGGVKRVFLEKVDGAYQGCVFRFIQGLEAGVNRMAWGPDGALYVGGIGSSGNWQQDGTLWYGLQRLKYNEKPTFEMLAVRAKANGMEIEFTEPLREGEGWDKSDYKIMQWWYKPTIEYGGPKLDEETLPIKSVNISEDRRKVFLELGGLKPNHVVYVHLKNHFTSANGNGLWSTEAWYTLNNIPTEKGFVNNTPVVIAPNTLSPSEEAAGWKLLFDGKTTTGWRNFKKESIGSSWVVEDGALILQTVKKPEGGFAAKDGGDIITDEQFENFELELEWKISNCGNSGIMYNVVESDDFHSVWQTGPEMQILDNTCHPDAQYETHKAGDLYDMIACKYTTVLPAGNWNKVRIVINNGHLEHWLNGHKVVDTQMWDSNWDEMVANSKFKDMPSFGKSRKGHISLQDHSDRISFRNIKIKVLDNPS
ncbi:MAG: family 16 glycoside hydrolase [Bacteroidota bacterium]